MNRIGVWMAKAFLEAACQAAHEWFAEMGEHGPRVLEAFQTRPGLVISIDEADALAHACARAVAELTGRGARQTTADRCYRRKLVDALAQLSKVGL